MVESVSNFPRTDFPFAKRNEAFVSRRVDVITIGAPFSIAHRQSETSLLLSMGPYLLSGSDKPHSNVMSLVGSWSLRSFQQAIAIMG